MNFIKKLIKRVFNRTTVCVLGIILQVVYLCSLCWQLGTLYTASYYVFRIIGVIVSLKIVGAEINPSYKIAWILVILTFPVFGVMFFIFFGNIHSGDRLRKRMNLYNEEERLLLSQPEEPLLKINGESAAAAKQAEYIRAGGGYPVYTGTKSTYFASGEEMFERLKKELKAAERFIFLEYFIIDKGEMWDALLEILIKKAAEGVDVRVVYDDIGCLLTLPYKYEKELCEKGVKCKVFNKFRPVWSAKMNNRDHRKIVVIDGEKAFCGGINIADEYINVREKYGRWKDSAVLLEGASVWSFTMMFLTMWNYLCGEKPSDYSGYMPKNANYGAGGFTAPFTDSPLDDEPLGENVYLNIINSAGKYVYITTPYLVIDNEMQTALTLAAKSGVDVRIITPHIPDKWFVHAVTRSHYKALTKIGVRVYEYTPGFIHAKNFISDDTTAVVGTINLDFRSLYLHFECAAWMYKTDCISDIKADFLNTLSQCKEITREDCKKENFFVKILRSVLRLFAPMM